MPLSLINVLEPKASLVAAVLHKWAENNGGLLQSQGRGASDEATDLLLALNLKPNGKNDFAGQTLQRLKIVGITADDEQCKVGVMVKNQVTTQAISRLPRKIGDVDISYIGHTTLETLPPYIPQSSSLGGSRFYVVDGRFCCGSSITVAPIPAAGTLGALVQLPDGDICGLSNNHVTGDCNHTRQGMHVLCPAPMDAEPGLQPPTAIGTHHSFVRLNSGDPAQVTKQEVDAAIFRITALTLLSSIQGQGFYDTPNKTMAPAAGMKVKKVGRTTGLTQGTILGPIITPWNVPYQSPSFRSLVHFENIWAIAVPPGEMFSDGGDSGSLVVSEDGKHAVGLLFAGGGNISIMTPIDSVLKAFDATLVSGLNFPDGA